MCTFQAICQSKKKYLTDWADILYENCCWLLYTKCHLLHLTPTITVASSCFNTFYTFSWWRFIRNVPVRMVKPYHFAICFNFKIRYNWNLHLPWKFGGLLEFCPGGLIGTYFTFLIVFTFKNSSSMRKIGSKLNTGLCQFGLVGINKRRMYTVVNSGLTVYPPTHNKLEYGKVHITDDVRGAKQWD